MDTKAINYTSNGILACIEDRCLNLSKITYFIIEPSGINDGYMILVNGKGKAIFTSKKHTKSLLKLIEETKLYKKVNKTYFNLDTIYEISKPEKARSINGEERYYFIVNGETFSFEDEKYVKEVKELIKEL